MEKLLWTVSCVSAFRLPECRQDAATAPNDGERESHPPEAALFDDLTLATPLKPYGYGNPVMTQRFGADPYAIVYEDRMYLYMTGDTIRYSGEQILENNYSNINTIRILSSSDLVNWTEHPEIKAAGPNGAAKWAVNSWAPAAAYREIDGGMRFFVYFADNANGIGVLQGDSPIGPFTDPIGRALINRSTINCGDVTCLFDPAVLVDDDGRAYIYFGGGVPSGGSVENFTSTHPLPGTDRAVELGADMISIVGTPQALNVPFIYEDSGINKIGTTYYYSYCSNTQVHRYATNQEFPDAATIGKSLAITYMTGENPLGPYKLQKMILPNPGDFPALGVAGGNNHHCLVEFRGKWYMVYHSRLLEAALGLSGTGDGYRITSIDEVLIRPDGEIEEIEATRSGITQSGRFNPYFVTEAATFGVMAGLSTEEYQWGFESRMRVTGIDTGDWMVLYGVDFGSTGAKKFSCRVNPPTGGGGVIQIRQDSLDGTPIAYVVVEAGQSGNITVDLLRTVTGVHDLVFIFYGEGYSFEQWQFVQ